VAQDLRATIGSVDYLPTIRHLRPRQQRHVKMMCPPPAFS
jgi:hypothetical protein